MWAVWHHPGAAAQEEAISFVIRHSLKQLICVYVYVCTIPNKRLCQGNCFEFCRWWFRWSACGKSLAGVCTLSACACGEHVHLNIVGGGVCVCGGGETPWFSSRKHHHQPATDCGLEDQTAEHVLERCPLPQTRRKKCVADSSPATHQTAWQQRGTRKDGHVHLADWAFSIVAMMMKQQKVALQSGGACLLYSLGTSPIPSQPWSCHFVQIQECKSC